MVELKFKDIESLNTVTGALHKNGYKYSTFVIWTKWGNEVEHFVVQISGAKADEEIRFVGICERCVYREDCEWPKLHPKIKLKECPDFNKGEKNNNG